MKELTKKEATRRVNDLGYILEACYQRAQRIVTENAQDYYTDWGGEGRIKRLDQYVRRVEILVKNIGIGNAAVRLARELFIAVIRGDISVEDVEEGFEGNAQNGYSG